MRWRALSIGIALVVCRLSWLEAQNKTPVRPAPSAVSVPFVGCKSDGQAGPADAPEGPSTITMNISPGDAQKLAYYSPGGEGVLAPRGWNCFRGYGSSGDILLVAPQPLSFDSVFVSPEGFTGPVVALSHSWGQGSGRSEVAEIIARAFPDYKFYVDGVIKDYGLTFSFGPFPSDKLTRRWKNVVEFQTPPQAEGLGTTWWLKKGDTGIDGIATLDPQTFNMRLARVRLPANLAALAPVIIQHVDRAPFE